MNDKRYVAVYARQSVFNPDSISVDDQIEKSTRLADDETVVVYQDKGYTGANTQRPDFQRMMKDIQAGLIKKVIVWKLDRISRSVADFSLMINVFQEYDVSFSSVTESCLAIDDNPFSKAMIQIIMIFAELERNNIQARVRENYYSRLKMGMLGGGAAPFGFERAEYQINGKKCYMYIPNPSAAEIVQELMAFLHDLPVKAERQKAENLPEIKKLEMELAKIDKRIENYMDRLELAEGALITHINMKVNELESERKELSGKLIKLSIEASKPVDGGLNIDDVIREWPSYDVEQRNIVAKTFIKRVVVTDDAIKVTFNGGGKEDDTADAA